MVFVTGPVLGEQAWSVLGIALHREAALLLYSLDISRDDRRHRCLALVHQPGPRVGTEHAKHRELGLGDQMPVAGIAAEEVGVGRLVVRRTRRTRATRASRWLSAQLGATARPVAVETMADGISREAQNRADLAEADALGAHS
jgi:hypothetical protein